MTTGWQGVKGGGRHHLLNFQFWRPQGGYRHPLNRLTFNNYLCLDLKWEGIISQWKSCRNRQFFYVLFFVFFFIIPVRWLENWNRPNFYFGPFQLYCIYIYRGIYCNLLKFPLFQLFYTTAAPRALPWLLAIKKCNSLHVITLRKLHVF